MNKRIHITLIVLGIIVISAFSFGAIESQNNPFELTSKQIIFTAGSTITLSFSSKSNNLPILFINHSFGSSIIAGKRNRDLFQYTLPAAFSTKTGIIDWKLIDNGKILQKNQLEIIPNTFTKTKIENYLGPRSIQAGKTDFSMLVVIPTDQLDNPFTDNTSVSIHEQFIEDITFSEEKTSNFIAWKNISSKEKAGSILISSSCNSTITKELTTVIYPANPSNFNINFKRNHEFADGNQVTKFITSTILDVYGNIISDGTLVDFIISTKENHMLKTSASTINGVATGQILHPDFSDIWEVKAYINGLAESNTLILKYKPVITDFEVIFSKNGRMITVGPIESFMQQLIPDGAIVKLKIYHKNNLVEIKTITSNQGLASFYLDSDFYHQNSYSFKVEVLGISKNIETKNYAKINE